MGKDKELKDFRGQPFLGQIYWEDLDKDFLIRTMLVWQRQMKEFAYAGFHAEIAKRYGNEVAAEISERVVEHLARVSIPLLMEAANVQPKTLGEAINVLQLSLDSATSSRKTGGQSFAHMKMIDENHFRSELEWCPYLDEFLK